MSEAQRDEFEMRSPEAPFASQGLETPKPGECPDGIRKRPFRKRTRLIKANSNICQNPLCDAVVTRKKSRGEPRRYCSDQCRGIVSILKRAAGILSHLEPARGLEILSAFRVETSNGSGR